MEIKILSSVVKATSAFLLEASRNVTLLKGDECPRYLPVELRIDCVKAIKKQYSLAQDSLHEKQIVVSLWRGWTNFRQNLLLGIIDLPKGHKSMYEDVAQFYSFELNQFLKEQNR